MLTYLLEPTDDRADPLFKDAASCTQWLGQLQLTNLQLAHSLLLTQISELNNFPMRSLERFNTMEMLCETVNHVQEDYARKLTAKPLPFNESELMVFAAIVQLWQAMVLGYQRCLQELISGDRSLKKHAALLCQRCLQYSGMEILEHLRSGYEFEPALWRRLHELYAFAEQQDIHTTVTGEAPNCDKTHNSCRSVYVSILLACHARPQELTRTQLQLMNKWLSQWSSQVTVERGYTSSMEDAAPLAVDIDSTFGLLPANQVVQRSSVRYLAVAPLSKILRVTIILLQQGQMTPQQANLCERCTSNECLELLNFLLQCWCETSRARYGERLPVAQSAQLCYRQDCIYAHMSGKPFRQPMQSAIKDDAARKQIEVFGRVLQDNHQGELQEIGYPLEMWQFENESISGARLRREGMFGGRLSCNQLVALRPSDAGSFIMGITAWVSVTVTGQLRIGVRYLPGAAETVCMRAIGLNLTISENYVPAFMLPAMAVLNTPASLIITRDWFQPSRVVEILHRNGEKEHVKMGFSVERGLDYERVSFTTLEF